VRRFVLSAVCAGLAAVVVVGPRSAAAEPTEPELSKRLSDLEKDTAHRAALSRHLESAKRAIERSRRSSKGAQWAPQQGTTDRQAALFLAVAGEWLDVATDLVRTVSAEQAATIAQKRLDDAQTRIVRGKLLLEETIARRGRTQAQLEAADKPKSEPPPSTAPVQSAQPSAPPAAPAKKAAPAPSKPEPKE
jgi:hypothetical protein